MLLTYKGESQFSTFIGGSVSIVIIVAVAYYFVTSIFTMVNRQNSNNTLSTKVIDLNTEDQDYYLEDYGFMFGISITDISGNPFPLDPTLFTLEINQGTTVEEGNHYDNQETSLGYKVWDPSELEKFNPKYISRGLNASLYCPKNKRCIKKVLNIKNNYFNFKILS